MFAYRDTRGGDVRVDVAFTDSQTSFAERSGDDPTDLDASLSALAEACGVPLVRMHQVHGADVHVVTAGSLETVPRVDGLVTRQRGLGLVTRAADCVPVLLADPAAGVVGAVHAGRAGVASGVVGAALTAMRGLGAGEVTGWVGPHVCGACYEVPDAMREEVAAVVPETWSTTTWGTPALDLGAGVVAQLAAEACTVVPVAGCTREDPRWHSHRRDGEAAGRFAGVVWMRP